MLSDLVDEFLVHLRHERGQADHTQRTYAHALGQLVTWLESRGTTDWKAVRAPDLVEFLTHQRSRSHLDDPDSPEAAQRLDALSPGCGDPGLLPLCDR